MSAARLLAMVSLAIFVGEAAIMVASGYAPIESEFLKNAIDATALVVIVFPFLYYLVFKPVFKKNHELYVLKEQLLDARERLEERVDERTKDVEEANCALGESIRKLKSRHQEVILLGEMGNFFQACRDLEEAMRVAETQLRRLFPDLSGSLFVMNSSRNALERAASWGQPVAMESFHEPDDCWALRRSKPHVVKPIDRAIACRHNQSVDGVLNICLPLTANGEALGTLCLQARQTPDDAGANSDGLLDERMEFYVAAAENLALAISNLRLRETLRFQALRDPLTGLFNRRYLLETLNHELSRAAEHSQPLSIAMLDVDYFKRFNDSFGHAAGDMVLASLGAFFRDWAHGAEIVSRYGGEEFTIVLPNTSAEAASLRIESLRQGVEALTVERHGQVFPGVTISAGIATYPVHTLDCDALMRLADQALYSAKENGRNRVAIVPGTAGLRQILEAGHSATSSKTSPRQVKTTTTASLSNA